MDFKGVVVKVEPQSESETEEELPPFVAFELAENDQHVKTEREDSDVEEQDMSHNSMAADQPGDDSWMKRDFKIELNEDDSEDTPHWNNLEHHAQGINQISYGIHPERPAVSKSHSGIHPECDVTSTANKTNMPRHTGVKSYKCTECEASFLYPSGLKRHMQRHMGINPYKCTGCETAFAESGDWKRHMRIHTGVKSYLCTECEATFSRSSHLNMNPNSRAMRMVRLALLKNQTTSLRAHHAAGSSSVASAHQPQDPVTMDGLTILGQPAHPTAGSSSVASAHQFQLCDSHDKFDLECGLPEDLSDEYSCNEPTIVSFSDVSISLLNNSVGSNSGDACQKTAEQNHCENEEMEEDTDKENPQELEESNSGETDEGNRPIFFNDSNASVTEGETDSILEKDSEEKSETGKKRKKINKKKTNKIKRVKGEKYVGRKYDAQNQKYADEEKPARALGERCNCKSKATKCADITEEERKAIFAEIWEMSLLQKQVYVASFTEIVHVRRRTKDNNASSRRNASRKYNLKQATRTVRVCKKMFLRTTGLTEYFVRTYSSGAKEEHSLEPGATPASRGHQRASS